MQLRRIARNARAVSIHVSTYLASLENHRPLLLPPSLHPSLFCCSLFLFGQSPHSALWQIAVVHSNVWNCNHSCLWTAVINVLHDGDFDGQCGVCGEPSQRRTSAKWCAIIWSVWSFVIACGAECMMSRTERPPSAIIIVFINCIAADSWLHSRFGVMSVYWKESPHLEQRIIFVNNSQWDSYLACFFPVSFLLPQCLPGRPADW